MFKEILFFSLSEIFSLKIERFFSITFLDLKNGANFEKINANIFLLNFIPKILPNI